MDQASTSIRLNPFKGCGGPEGMQVPWSPYGRMLEHRPVFTLDPLFHAGCYYVQDSSAMYVGHIFRKLLKEFGPGIRVLDLCAAPGGKTTDLAASLRDAFGSSFQLVSNEVMKQRAAILRDNVAIWGDPNVVVTSVDPAAFARIPSYFDIIVVDAPCSGEGMFRKDARAVEEWSPEVVDLCAARQKRILADVWPALKEGGFLIYSTCTYEDSENDSNLEWAAYELGGSIVNPEDEFPEYGVRLTRCGNLLKVGEVPGEGQWVGAMRRTSPSETPGRKAPGLEMLRPILDGVCRGETKGKDFIPNADWALSYAFPDDFCPGVEVDRDTALAFLHRDTFRLPGAPLGYNVIKYHGHPLGFVKNLGTRCNNLHPQSRRILMNVK